MTTTPNLHTLADDPQAFDTVLASLTDRMGDYMRKIAASTERLHELASDRKSYRNTRVPVWSMTTLEVERAVQRMAAHDDTSARIILSDRAGFQVMLDAILAEIDSMNRAYTGWTRFFPSVTKSQPHIHRTLTCRTLHASTVMSWAPALSGKTDEQAVAELDEALCSVCFPDAPVALHNYVSRHSQAERVERAAEKAARDADKAAKTLTEAEQFRTAYGRDRITTVAACKEVIRRAVQEKITLEGYGTEAFAARWTGDRESLSRLRSNVASGLVKMEEDARAATRVLIDREMDHEGWGMTADAIDQMMIRKAKAERKAWGL